MYCNHINSKSDQLLIIYHQVILLTIGSGSSIFITVSRVMLYCERQYHYQRKIEESLMSDIKRALET
jgi:uncharacterized membrane protein YgaE (UPF0421/DUF939 family)